MNETEQQGTTEITIHVRFAPDGSVCEISARPDSVAPQAWFNGISNSFGSSFRALTGGRGIFVVAADKITALQSQLAQPH